MLKTHLDAFPLRALHRRVVKHIDAPVALAVPGGPARAVLLVPLRVPVQRALSLAHATRPRRALQRERRFRGHARRGGAGAHGALWSVRGGVFSGSYTVLALFLSALACPNQSWAGIKH